MTVLTRDDLNDADLAWAAADAAIASVMGEVLRARAAVAAEAPVGSRNAATSSRPAYPAAGNVVYLGGRR